ncbi:hypothetical protein O6H91_02G151300 [Diphasiastrum complanatum]|uniref:Uncharacterized protein n=14 Tax=Diphasiastrum complanatum TaxID=34168 RepID=A0ACC2EMA8_DIPCM|nr:hypothetical protein O6H91_02G151300 [Diphasiastrum complanatum]KAJ7567516.1 hypothetical protein O6H91_02G151300 [Diphasiastrum complanatum]KAJ7567517.1 hypothetical protein O6H91_02G151300 [Diphasiastrum complanatum]KAJ7567518.1 hypothetical protein O6H91_02G151300 [Diphasiastrum complanatum]KAJ7567519.1 hypothetical protein O6H91_02G151300 [Diphasiastrum complanatum]
MAVGMEQVVQWLTNTTSPDEAVVRSATIALASTEAFPGFGNCLLTIAAGGHELGQRLAAATYLKNFIRNHWSDKGTISSNDCLELRTRLVEVLLRVDYSVLKLLIEAFRLITVEDFAGEHCSWPELVPALQIAVQNSDLAGSSQLKILNVLMAVQTIAKPFQYFVDPTVAREPVPEQLELISKGLIVPLHEMFHQLVEQAVGSKYNCAAQHDDLLLILNKIFHLAVRSHMPISLLAHLSKWFQGFLALLELVILEETMGREEQVFRLKTWKRVLQIFCTFITRHRKHIDKFLPSMSSAALRIVGHSAICKTLHPMQERIISLAFDVISNVLETGPGWRLLAPHFLTLLENAIFPALTLKEKDMVEWEDDEEEYLRKNLPSDLDDASGWRVDLFTPRRSALNLLGLVATSKGPPTVSGGKKNAAIKRKKGSKAGLGKDDQGTAGELLVIPFLSRYALPPDGDPTTMEPLMNYYGVLLAYGGLQEFLKGKSDKYVELLLTSRVLPLYSMLSPSPYVLANANWLLGELAGFLPMELNQAVYESLLKALAAPDIGSISWRPVRTSAAGALCALLQEEYKPKQWLPLLQAAVAGARVPKDEEAAISLQLLANAADVGEQDIAPHIPAIVEAMKEEISKHIPSPPEPWPQVVELGFSAVASLAQAWDNAEPDESEDGGKSLRDWRATCTTVAKMFSELLQQCWLSPAQNGAPSEVLPPPSCLNHTSIILCTILKYTSNPDDVPRMKIEQLLQVWADLVADWNAWEEEEDGAVFDAIVEALNLHERCPLEHFAAAEIPMPPFPPVPSRSILEALSLFLCSAIESAYSAAVWRACRLSHSLLHATVLSSKGESLAQHLVIRFTEAAYMRLQKLTSVTVPLAKPLILVIATCYTGLPVVVEMAMSSRKQSDDGTWDAFLTWGEALAAIAENGADPGLTLESELKLAVMALLKVLKRLLDSQLVASTSCWKLANHCFRSIIDATIQMKEVEEADEEEADDTLEDADDEEDAAGSNIDDDEDDDDDEREETEEEFLERYAQTARELEEEVAEGAEGGQEEDGHELELGVFVSTDLEAAVLSCIQRHGLQLISQQPLPQDLVNRFTEKFPQSKCFFPAQ